MSNISLPYLPENREILYVSEENKFLQAAKRAAEKLSLDKNQPIGCVIVKNGKIIGTGANGSKYHEKYGCERKRQNIPTGQGYELCEGCHPKNHGEQSTIKNVQENYPENYAALLEGSDLYLWGHWWCCESCWSKMIEAKIKNIYLWEYAAKNWAS